MAQVVEMEARGHYLASEAGRLAGVSGYKMGQWARRGYVRSSRSESRPRVYSYQDIAEAMIVHELLDRGVKQPEILEAVETLRHDLGTAWPLAQSDLAVTVYRRDDNSREPGKAASWLLSKHRQRYVRPSKSMTQGVLDIDVVRVAKDLERGGWIVRELPNLRHIEVNPDVMSGRPVVKGTRVSAEAAGRLSLRPDGAKTLKDDYELTPAQIRDVKRWWEAVSRYEVAA